MASLNSKTITPAPRTHEGAVASRIGPQEQLTRVVMACMLWEDNFYVDGVSTADLIKKLVHQVPLEVAGNIAIQAREDMKLRHVPLLIVREMARHPRLKDNPKLVSETIARVIQRADELTEFMAIYWKDKKQPLSKQVKLGLAKAFAKFNEYELAKYNRDKDIKLKDVLFLCHSKPADVVDGERWDKAARAAYAAQPGAARKRILIQTGHANGFTEGELLYGKLIYDQLETPNTWETRLSGGENKACVFIDLMNTNQLGDLAFLRNLRNMRDAGVPYSDIKEYGDKRRWGRVLPFRFLSAARMVPQFEPNLEQWMFKCTEQMDKMKGRTALVIDVSGSMSSKVSGKSELSRLDAAKALAMLLREICEDVDIYTFNTQTKYVPARRGFALGDAIGTAGGGTNIEQAWRYATGKNNYNRMIILTDEQSHTSLPHQKQDRRYIINVAAYQQGVGYKSWLHVNGWSEAVINYIQAYENQF